MNRYPLWKYLLLAFALLLGTIYAAPNLFGDDPAVQVTMRRAIDIPPEALANIEATLAMNQLAPKARQDQPDRVLLRFDNTEQQLAAKDYLGDALGDNYVVALNLAPATPNWLASLGGNPLSLGLDLQGGVHFLMEVDMDAALAKQLESIQSSVRDVLREERVRYIGVRRDRGGLLIELRSEEDLATAERLIRREVPELTFDRAAGNQIALRANITEQQQVEMQQNAVQQNVVTLRNRVNELGVAEPIVQQQGANRIVVELPGVQDPAEAKIVLSATATLEYRAVDQEGNALTAAETGRAPPGTRLYYDRQGSPVLLKNELIVTGDQLINAASGFDQQDGSPMVSVTLDGAGAARMYRFTRDNVGKPMAVVFVDRVPVVTENADGTETRTFRSVEEVISIANIREPFSQRFQTTGLDSPQEAAQLALLLRAGALAAPIDIIEERTVGPSLGQDNIEKGRLSVIIGFFIVMVFMAVYYRVFGVIADIALVANLVLLIALLSMLGATLTLPGIAGIVLTVGMAVDANVLIFERIREEIRAGNTPQAAIKSGYEKAFSTIADANVTTLIAALVLFTFGTGPIKGFAVTLSLGILTSMFTAILGSRALVNLYYGRRKRLKTLAI